MKTMCLVCAVAVLAMGVGGCRVSVDKDANGQEKQVHVDTPFGGVHVNTDQTSAADLGLPLYPGAEAVKGDKEHESADVNMGFGEWQLRVKVASYETPDSKEKVTAFYKKALAKYGDVLTCKGHDVEGSPTITADGLSCSDDGSKGAGGVHISDISTDGLELKAGSKRHQHIVAFSDPKQEKTRFALVLLDLPAGMGSQDAKSN